MNPMTNVKNIKKLSEQELTLGLKTSWHDQYKDSAWIFIGGLPYDLTEGDVLCIFSQYGEIVNINLVRDKATGKQKGFCFICYEDQRSTTLAVDNFNGIKILNRTLRVDHVADYKAPKDVKIEDPEMARLRKEGCAPTIQTFVDATKIKKEPVSPPPVRKIKKEKKEKRKLKKKKIKKPKQPSSSDDDDSESYSDNKRDSKKSKKSKNYSSDDDSDEDDRRKKPSKKKKYSSDDSESEGYKKSKKKKHYSSSDEEKRKVSKKPKKKYSSDDSESEESDSDDSANRRKKLSKPSTSRKHHGIRH